MKVANKSNITHKKIALRSADLMPDEATVVAVLHKRAAFFAVKKLAADDVEEQVPYIKFKLGEQDYYGIPNLYAKEVLQSPITSVPGAPDYVAGVLNYRGTLITIVNLKRLLRLNSKRTATTDAPFIVITAADSLMVGMLVDTIEDSNAYKVSNLSPPMDSSSAVKPEYVIGLHLGKTTIININKILADIKGEHHE